MKTKDVLVLLIMDAETPPTVIEIVLSKDVPVIVSTVPPSTESDVKVIPVTDGAAAKELGTYSNEIPANVMAATEIFESSDMILLLGLCLLTREV